MMERRERAKFYVGYVIVFCVMTGVVFFPFWSTGKNFIWKGDVDGLYQHYNAFIYLGVWIRNIIKTIIFEHKLVIPMWEFSIGYGADIINTLAYYVVGDPFALVSVFIPVAYSEIGYVISILLRYFAAGITFCMYARKWQCKFLPTLCGAMIYVFSAYTLFAGIRHPYFMNPCIYLPLLLLGVEKILRGEKPFFFIGAVFVATVSNFYFFYMLVLLVVIYVLIRVTTEPKSRNIKNICFYCLKFGIYALIGISMAAIIFLPTVINFIGNSRVGNGYLFEPFYSRAVYEGIPGSFVAMYQTSSWKYVGVAPVALIGIIGVFMEKKKKLWLKIWNIILGVFLFFPVVGYAFNGFGYVTDRWIFVIPFVIAFSFALQLPFLYGLDDHGKWILYGICMVYTIICMILGKSRREETMVGCALLLISVAVLIWRSKNNYTKNNTSIGYAFVLSAVVSVNIFFQSYYRYSMAEGNYISEFTDWKTAYAALAEDRASAWQYIKDKDFYRIDDTPINNGQYNYLLTSGKSTTTEYWSLINPYIIEFIEKNSAYTMNSNGHRGLLSRTMLLPLASVKYYVAGELETQKKTVPYTYKNVKEDGQWTPVYKTEYSLPFGYTYDSVIDAKEYDSISVVQRQQATLQSAVIQNEDQEECKMLSKEKPIYSDRSIEFEVLDNDQVAYDGKSFVVKENGGSVTLHFSSPAENELYVYLEGLTFESKSASDFMTEDEIAKETLYNKKARKRSEKYWIPSNVATITVMNEDGVSTGATYFTPKNQMYHGREDFLFNLYYSDNERTTITLKFNQRGIYTFDNLEVICQPMDHFKEQVERLKEDELTKVKFMENRIEGEIFLEEAKLLCLSLPYAEGWKCLVDGEKVDLLRTNIMYTGVMLEPGEHKIELTYCTPYLKTGAVISVFGWILFVSLILIDNKNKKLYIK